MDRVEEAQGSDLTGLEQAVGNKMEESVRVDVERRDFTWRTVFYGFLRSRRREARRGSEDEPMFTDWHHPWLFFLSIGIMLMSVLDALLTMQLLARGALELNPVMAFVINKGAFAFIASKMALTGFGILSLVYLARSRFLGHIRTGLILTLFFSAYATLVCYEFVSLINRL